MSPLYCRRRAASVGHGTRSRHLTRLACASIVAAALGGLPASATGAAPSAPDARPSAGPAECHVGTYSLPGGTIVDVGRTDDGLRWRDLDGRTGKLARDGDAWRSTLGWTDRPDGIVVKFGPCGAGAIDFGGRRGRVLAFDTTEATFESRGTKLHGRLVMPRGHGPVPVVVLLQGSEFHSARDYDPLQRLLPALGVGTFVYDKRGTGASGGEYTQDFSLLADDAIAALGVARRLAAARVARIGFQGPSQGGWVAPIAASRERVDFVIVSFGLAVSVLHEDREAIEFQMRLKGHGPEIVARALEIGAAAARVFESGFVAGIEEFDAVRTRHRDAHWFKDVHGNFTGLLLAMTPEQIRTEGARFRWGTPFAYDPLPTLERLDVPQLWVVGGQDVDAPSGDTVRRLDGLIAKGRPVTLAIYPSAEHGMTEFETSADGARTSTRYASGYFRLMADYARDGKVGGPYGAARIRGASTRDASAAPAPAANRTPRGHDRAVRPVVRRALDASIDARAVYAGQASSMRNGVPTDAEPGGPYAWANVNAAGVGPFARRCSSRAIASSTDGRCPAGTHHSTM